MALIKCEECGKEISDKAKACPFCGCPLSEMEIGGIVRIKIPNNLVEGVVGLFSSRDCSIKTNDGTILWKGQHGENASFRINSPTEIIVDLGFWGNPIKGTVEPRKKYALVQDRGMHLLATYRITEVDMIDSE